MASRLVMPALAVTLCLVASAATAADFKYYRTVKHSDEIMFHGRSVDDLRDMRPVDPHGLKLGEIDGVLVDDSGLLIDQNKVAAIILDVRGKIAKNKKVIIGADDLKLDPTNHDQIIVNKSASDLRTMHNWGSD